MKSDYGSVVTGVEQIAIIVQNAELTFDIPGILSGQNAQTVWV